MDADSSANGKESMEDMRTLFFYRICGWCLLAAVVLLVILNLFVVVRGAESVTNLPAPLMLPIGIIGAAGALSCCALWPSMMWHCLVVSRISVVKKIAWFALLLFTIPLGTVIYYFVMIEAA